MRSAEFATIRAARRAGRGTGDGARGTMDKGTAKTADGGQRPGIGIRKPGTGKIPRHLEPTTGGQALEPETWNYRYAANDK